MSAVLSFQNVSVRKGTRVVLGPIDWDVNAGERWVILGPNGAGKTTLLQMCATFAHPTTGTVSVLGKQLGKIDLFELRNRVGFTSSAMIDLLPPDEKVIDTVLTAAYAMLERWEEIYDLWDESRAKALLTTFGVRELGERLFGTLSEGEKKRVQIARAIMSDPEILLLDEPAAGLDLGGREDILRRISQFASEPTAPATVIVTHHIEEIPAGTTHVLLLKDGLPLRSGSIAENLTSATLSQLYGIPITLEFNHGRYYAIAE